jgi:putative ABC transport system permease protein
VLADWLASNFGLFLSANIMSAELAIILCCVVVAAVVAALLPAIEAYRKGLQTQLSK